VLHELETLGWRTLVIWECKTTDAVAIRDVLGAFLGRPGRMVGGKRAIGVAEV
jgi:G:T-mismatch repair DNA endonuclease (very short patch repair protein)